MCRSQPSGPTQEALEEEKIAPAWATEVSAGTVASLATLSSSIQGQDERRAREESHALSHQVRHQNRSSGCLGHSIPWLETQREARCPPTAQGAVLPFEIRCGFCRGCPCTLGTAVPDCFLSCSGWGPPGRVRSVVSSLGSVFIPARCSTGPLPPHLWVLGLWPWSQTRHKPAPWQLSSGQIWPLRGPGH